MTRLLATIALLLALAAPSGATCPVIHRSRAVLRAFVKLHPCPLTGKPTLSCRSADGTVRYVLDHVVPLCLGPEAGGIDAPSNVAWQEYHAALIKDRWERRQCHVAPGHCAHQGD
jgi:hypothetical protein